MPCASYGSTGVCLAAIHAVRCVNGVECPSNATGDFAVTACVAEVTSDPVVENEDAVQPDKGCVGSDYCWKIEPCTDVTGENVTLRLGAWDPLLMAIATGDTVYFDASGNPTGTGFKKGQRCQVFSLEIWGQLGTQNPNCGPTGLPCVTHYAWPHLKGGYRSGVTLSATGIHYAEITGTVAEAPTCWNNGSPGVGGAHLGPRGDFGIVSPTGYNVATDTNKGDISSGPSIWCGLLPSVTCPVRVN